jgi:unsaturated rhamnogalacturonyl hydrolase
MPVGGVVSLRHAWGRLVMLAAGLPLLATTACAAARPAGADRSGTATATGAAPDKAEVVAVMRRVNDRWIDTHPDPGDNGWARATYFEGDLAAYEVFPAARYLAYATEWGGRNGWALGAGAPVRHADDLNAAQTYLDLYRIDPQPERIAEVDASLAAMMADSRIGDWTWVDALQMAMPVFAKGAAVHGDAQLLERLHEMYEWTRGPSGLALFNAVDGLWWRDARFKPPMTTPGGAAVYWSRGNGWAFAAHVRTIAELAPEDPQRSEYVAVFRRMAAALAVRQRPDGLWGSSLHDPDHATGPESSGTAFFVYGMAWGIRTGLLDPTTYMPAVIRGWRGLTTIAVHPDGTVGFVQPPGDRPGRAGSDDTYDYGVGAFLLAASEVALLVPGDLPKPVGEQHLRGARTGW